MVKETELIYLGKAKDKLWLGIMFLPFKSNYDIKVNTFYIIVIDDNIYKIVFWPEVFWLQMTET